MIDHISICVSDIEKSKAFYEAALKPAGYQVQGEFPGSVLLGAESGGSIWLLEKELSKIHVAFTGTRADVDAFHEAAMATGGTDHGAPGIRPDYHENYYAAFVLDPDGNNIEVVCHDAV